MTTSKENHNELIKLYSDCLYEIGKRIDVIRDHLNGITVERYKIIEVETICLQFRKLLEKIALMSLIPNKNLYIAEYTRISKLYHAKWICKDLERINPNFYPVPVQREKLPDGTYNLKPLPKDKHLTKEEFIKIYEICGGMLHATNPFGSEKDYDKVSAMFVEWLTKITNLIYHHCIQPVDQEILLIAMLKTTPNDYPQVVICEQIDDI